MLADDIAEGGRLADHELRGVYEIAGGLLRLAESEQYLGHPGRAVRLHCAAQNVYASIGAWQPEDDAGLEEHRIATLLQITALATEDTGGFIFNSSSLLVIAGSRGFDFEFHTKEKAHRARALIMWNLLQNERGGMLR